MFIGISFVFIQYFDQRYQYKHFFFDSSSKLLADIAQEKKAILLCSGYVVEKTVPNNGKQKIGIEVDRLVYWTDKKKRNTKKDIKIEHDPFLLWFEMRFKLETVNRGQRVEVELPAQYLTLTKDVDSSYGQYLANKEVIAKGFLFNPAQISVSGSQDSDRESRLIGWLNHYRRLIGSLQNDLQVGLKKHLGIEAYGLSYALLTGDKGGIASESKEIFRLTGVYHVLAVSGMHAGILTAVFFSLLRLVGSNRKTAMGMILFLILPVYMCVADFQVSLIRTYFMLLLAYYLRIVDRKTEPMFIVLFSLIISTLVEPSLAKSISFQLSYSAVIGIMFALKIIEIYRIKNWIWQYVWISIGAQSATLPFVLYYFGYFNYLSIFYSLPISLLLSFSLLFSIFFALTAPFGSAWSILPQYLGGATKINNLFSIKLLDWTYISSDSFYLIEGGNINGAIGVCITVVIIWVFIIRGSYKWKKRQMTDEMVNAEK